jgi:hypothetical protein
MKASDIFQKTASGLSEIGNRGDALTAKQRRVLILVNGKNDTSTLKKLSLCNNIAEILDTLLRQGFIDRQGGGTAYDYAPDTTLPQVPEAYDYAPDTTLPQVPEAYDYAPDTTLPQVPEAGARELMCSTLMIFSNRDSVGELIEQINAVEDIDSLKELIRPWHQAMTETPSGTCQADELRQEVLQMIQDEEINGLL